MADICMTFMEKGSYKRQIFVTKTCDVDMVLRRLKTVSELLFLKAETGSYVTQDPSTTHK